MKMMSSSAKVIEKLKRGIQKMDKVKRDDTDNEEILPLIMDDLTPALIEEARTHLKETDEVRNKALVELRQLVESEKNLVVPTDDGYLLAFLRSRKFNIKKAFKLLQNFWLFRKEYRAIFDGANYETVKSLVLRNFLGLLHYRDRKGCAILIVKIGEWDPDQDTFEDLFVTISAILTYCVRYPATQVAGLRMIIDARNLSWVQMKYCTPANILMIIRSTQFCFPARYKGFHILTENKLFNLCWAIVFPMLTSKLKKRVILQGSDLTPLLDYIHLSVLPDEYGGKGGPFDNSGWTDFMDKEESSMKEMLNYGYRD